MNYIDIIAIIVIALGTILGIFIGFRKKHFNSIIATISTGISLWVASLILKPVTQTDWYRDFATNVIKNETVASWIGFVALYLVCLIVIGLLLKLLTLPLMKLLTNEQGVLSHILGGIHGLVISISLVAFALIIAASIPSIRDSIEGLSESNSFSLSLTLYDYFVAIFGQK